MKTTTRKQRFRQLQVVFNQGLNACIIELAQEYLRDYPKHGVVWLDYGNALVDFARYKEARVALLRAIKHLPKQHTYLAYGYMGQLYDTKGDHGRAADWFRKASKLAPDNASYLIFLGATLAKAGKLSEARRYHRLAIKCKEGAIDEGYYNLGYILGAQGRYKVALSCFEKAIELDPKYKIAKQAAKDMRRALEIRAMIKKDGLALNRQV